MIYRYLSAMTKKINIGNDNWVQTNIKFVFYLFYIYIIFIYIGILSQVIFYDSRKVAFL